MPDSEAFATSRDIPVPEIPDFELHHLIGRGGFGDVWLARNRTTGHLRAVKVISLRRSNACDAAGREIMSLTCLEARLRHHPNLLSIQHIGKTAESLFYVMELADDLSGAPPFAEIDYRPATLESRLANGPLSSEQCLRCAQELLRGIAVLHEAGVVHRDVKPANCVFVGGELKLADFGLVAEASPLVSRVGTQKYMPPDGRMDARADIYAAGLVLYELITGLPADSFPRLGQQAEIVVRNPVLSSLMRLSLRACQSDARERYQDARQMLAELEADRGEARSRAAQSRRWMLVSTTALIFGIVAAAGTWWATRPPQVHANFITYPFEATIRLDGAVLVDADGKVRRTPCTVDGLTVGVHRVVFHRDGYRDLDMGDVDLARHRQVVGRWEP